MRYGLMGRSGLRVSELFLGTMTFGAQGGGSSVEESRRMLDAYAEAGGNVLDTASVYGSDGSSERILGDWLGADRDRFVVATKYSLPLDRRDPIAGGNHRKSLVRSLERSLTRLKTHHVDVLWVHLWDPATPIEETMRALDDAVRAGKVLYVGISDAPAWVVARANAIAELRGWTSFIGIQVPYSLVKRDIERELLPMAEALDLAVAAWAPLAGGVLAGRFSRGAATPSARVDPAAISQRRLSIAREVDEVADELGVSSAQVALAWAMARSPAIHPIIGASSTDQLADNLAATEMMLPADAQDRLDRASTIDLGFPLDFITGVLDPPAEGVRRSGP